MFDTVQLNFDLDGDGIADVYAQEVDLDGDGIADALAFDMDSDGILDSYALDSNGDGVTDLFMSEFDTDGDGITDKFMVMSDEDGDGVYETGELYDYDASDGTLELINLEGDFDTDYDTMDNFDPDNYDPDDISGDPAHSMEEWEFQGDTNRCAIYSQKFVIDELTGEDMDIEDLADLAEENGWFTEEGGTPLLNMNKILDYYGIDNEMSFHNDMDDLKECLDAGGKAIVSIDSGEVWEGESDSLFDPSDGADHAVEVIGIDYSDPDDPMVILNDSGHPDGCGELVPMDTFIDAWEDGGCQMIACM